MNRDGILALAGKHISLDRHNSGLANQHELTSFANALLKSYKAELLKEVGEPVAARRKVAMWQGGDDYKYEWAVVKEHTPGTEPLYTSDQVAAAILKATKPLDERIQRRMDDIRLQAERQVALEEKFREVSAQLAAAQEEITALKQVPADKREDLRCVVSDLCDQHKELREQLATAEQRVAEACALQVATETKFHWLDAARVAKEIRSGEWRKFLKEEV